MRKHNFAFIDIETTGLDVINHEIIEIGCVLTTPELQVIEEFEMKIKPEHLENADPVSLKSVITRRIYGRMHLHSKKRLKHCRKKFRMRLWSGRMLLLIRAF